MDQKPILAGVIISSLVIVCFLFCAMRHCRRRLLMKKVKRRDPERGYEEGETEEEEEEEEEDIFIFPGGENLTAHDILDAPGEVVGKSCYGTLYKARLERDGSGGVAGGCCGGGGGSLVLLRFVRPACVGRTKEILPSVQVLGFVRHPNLVPLQALYVGPRGEKLLVHPFFSVGTLSHFLRDGNFESRKWEVIHKLALGIAKGLDHLHNGLLKPIIHGNLKSKNILLDTDYQPRLSDYGLHLLLSPTVGQEMLEISAVQGYKAPELIKMKDASKESDIYSFGVILLEMVSHKEPTIRNLSLSLDLHLPSSIRNNFLEHKVSEIYNSDLLRQSKNENSLTEEGTLMYFQLAMVCCSPSPSLRPDITQVLTKLNKIGP